MPLIPKTTFRGSGFRMPTVFRTHVKSGTKVDFGKMIPVTNVSVKNYFFNAKWIRERMDGLTYNVFRRFGAFVRQRAKSSILKRKSGKSSIPGRPPRSHTGALRKNIFFAFNPATTSVVIGPVLLEGRKYEHLKHNTKTVPEALEFGGPSWAPHRIKIIEIRKRPYMWPAFKYVVQKELPGIWEYCSRNFGGLGDMTGGHLKGDEPSMKTLWTE